MWVSYAAFKMANQDLSALCGNFALRFFCGGCIAEPWFAAAATRHYLFSAAALLSACSGCAAQLAELAARKPASIGRFRAGGPETRVNTGLAGSPSGDTRFTRGLGQVGWLARMRFAVCHLPTAMGLCPTIFRRFASKLSLPPVFASARRPQPQAGIMQCVAAATTPAIAARR